MAQEKVAILVKCIHLWSYSIVCNGHGSINSAIETLTSVSFRQNLKNCNTFIIIIIIIIIITSISILSGSRCGW